MNESLEHKLQHLPTNSGVYIYRNKKGDIIYIGKAKNLKNRIKSYFNNIGKHKQFKTEILVKKIEDLEYIITDSELEALLLEANLIKKHKPKYNIDLKDDKSYPYIRVTNELYPNIFITRKIIKDGSKYLGPYTNVKAIRNVLKSFKKIFKIRTCMLNITEKAIQEKKYKVCLNYHIKICSGVCCGYEPPQIYQQKIKDIVGFISGKDNSLVKKLNLEMSNASEEMRFEDAALYRDQIKVLHSYQSDQKVENSDMVARDYIAISAEDNDACCVIFKVRSGRLISRNHFFLTGVYKKGSLLLIEEFIKLYYAGVCGDFPEELILKEEIDDAENISKWLSKINGKRVYLKVPQKGIKSRMLFLAEKNAQLLLNDNKLEKMKKDYTPRSLQSLKRDLRLNKIPQIIECFDISHFAGRETVASLVCFKNAKPYKSRYRRFKIKTVPGIDDFASMREVVSRRYSRLKEETSKDNPLPDLIMVDGGKGQLSSAVHILEELGLTNIPIIGLAKRLEEVFKPGESEPEMIPRTSSSLKLLQQLRDESHRFAITYHRNLRGKKQIESILDGISGLGKVKKTLLLNHFHSIKNILEADIKELLALKGITQGIVDQIKKLK